MKDMLSVLQTKKAEIEKQKSERDKLEGKKEQAMSSLNDKFDCDSLDEGDKLYEENKANLDETKTEITEEFETLKEKYDW